MRALKLVLFGFLIGYAVNSSGMTEQHSLAVIQVKNHLDRFELAEARRLLEEPILRVSPKAKLVLGAFLLDNPGYESGEFEAYYLLKEARDMGESSANLMLGYLYDRTDRHPFHTQTFKSKLGAFKSYMAASEQREPEAFWALAAAYFEGRIVERDVSKTRLYSEDAAKLGLPVAQYLTAILYSGVEGLDSNSALSEFWMCKAVASGFEDALIFAKSEGLCGISTLAVNPPIISIAPEKRQSSTTNSGESDSSPSQDFFGLFMGAFFEALGEVAVYKLTGIDPPAIGVLSDEDREEFQKISRQEARRAARHQQRMQNIYKNIKGTCGTPNCI